MPFDNTLANLEFHSRKNRRITYALNARQQRQISALEVAFDERVANLQTNHKCTEDRLSGQLKVLQAAQKESEQKLLVRLNDMSVKVEMCNKTIKTQLDQLGRHSRGTAGGDGGQIMQRHIQAIKKSHEVATSELQKEFQELKRQVICQHHQSEALEPQLPAINLDLLKAAEEKTSSVSSESNDKSPRKDHDQTTTEDIPTAANGSRKTVAATKQEEQKAIERPDSSQFQSKQAMCSDVDVQPEDKAIAEDDADSSSSSSDAPHSDDQFQDDAESLGRQLRMLAAPRPNDRAQFEVFMKRVRRLMAQTPFKVLKVRVIRHAKDLCLGLASEWWCDIEEELWEQVSEGRADVEDKGKEKLEGETGTPPKTPDKAHKTASSSKSGSASSPSVSVTSKIESSPSGSSSSKRSTLAASNPFVSPCSAAIEKVLAKIGPFSGLHFDRWSRRVQTAWDANTDAEFRSELLKSLPRLLKGEPARVVAANEAFASFDQWEAWKMALFMSLSPA